MANILDNEVNFEYLFRTPETVSRKVFGSTNWRIAYINHGEADWKIDEKTYRIKPGTLVLLHNKFQRIISRIHTDSVSMWIINMSPQFIFNFGFTELFDSVAGKNPPVIDPCPQEIVSHFKTVVSEFAAAKNQSQIMIYSATLMILAHLCREWGIVSEPGFLEPKMKKVLDFIDSNFSHRIYLAQLSEMACMTNEAFSRYFKKINGINVSRYILHKRILKAIRLLEATDLTVLDIAMQCGFENMANFYKTFHSSTGHTPSVIRSRKRSGGIMQKNIQNSHNS